jgi:hypothetical protein
VREYNSFVWVQLEESAVLATQDAATEEGTMATLPYVTAPGNIEKALNGIRAAETPDRVTQDFVKTILKIPGGSGNQMASYLKKIGFVNNDGSPSDVYRRFRNPTTSGEAALEALRAGYGPLYKRNEYMHELNENDLKGLVIEVTGQSKDSSVPGNVVAAINALKGYVKEAKKHSRASTPRVQEPETRDVPATIALPRARGLGMNLSYTINLNLPATSDIGVFNAIFRSLKENLLRDTYEE